jgi:hypothetical protein
MNIECLKFYHEEQEIMFDLGDLEGDQWAINRVVHWLFMMEGLRWFLWLDADTGPIGVDVEASFSKDSGESLILINKKYFNLVFPLYFREIVIAKAELRAVKDMTRNGTRKATIVHGIARLTNVRVTQITDQFDRGVKEMLVKTESVPGILVKARTGRPIPELSTLTQVRLTWGDNNWVKT